MLKDSELRDIIEETLDCEPGVNSAHVGVSVANGIVTLAGHVASYTEKLAVERAVARLRGVKGIAEELGVRLPNETKRGDDEIAERARKILGWDTAVPDEQITIKVEHGRITLNGRVNHYFQKVAAERDVQKLGGVTGVVNLVVVEPPVRSPVIREQIASAFKRDAALDAAAVTVTMDGDRVILDGQVSSWRERLVAEQAAWATTGVAEVENRLIVA